MHVWKKRLYRGKALHVVANVRKLLERLFAVCAVGGCVAEYSERWPSWCAGDAKLSVWDTGNHLEVRTRKAESVVRDDTELSSGHGSCGDAKVRRCSIDARVDVPVR